MKNLRGQSTDLPLKIIWNQLKLLGHVTHPLISLYSSFPADDLYRGRGHNSDLREPHLITHGCKDSL